MRPRNRAIRRHPQALQLRILDVEADILTHTAAANALLTATPALYRTRITHMRRTPVHHHFEHQSYSWYVDVDRMPRIPRWLRAVASFDPADYFDGIEGTSLRERIDAFLAEHDIAVPDGRITALIQARVLGYQFNPLCLFWVQDRDGILRYVVAAVHNTRGERHAYLLPPANTPVLAAKRVHGSPFHPVDGYYVVCAPQPDSELDVSITLHREGAQPFVATMHGQRLPSTAASLLRLQLVAPMAPLAARLDMWVQAVALWLRRVPRPQWRPGIHDRTSVIRPAMRVEVTRPPGRSVAS